MAVLASVGAGYLVVEAMEEREVATAAVDLRFNALVVISHTRSLEDHDAQGQLELSAAVDHLEGDHNEALHGVNGTELTGAQELIDKVAGHGRMVLTDIDHLKEASHEPDEAVFEELLNLLGRRAEEATADASAAEQQVTFALALAVLAGALAGWLTLRASYRSASDRAVEQTRLRAGERFERLLEDSSDVFILVDRDGRIAYRSSSAGSFVEPSISTLSELLDTVADPGDRDALAEHLDCARPGRRQEQCILKRLDGQRGSYEILVSDLTSDEIVDGHLVTIRDVTQEERLRQDLVAQASTDPLTGLANRRALPAILEGTATEMSLLGTVVALVSLDLDGFKDINDTLGHQAGDDVLVQVTSRLRLATRPTDILLRVGGDEFVVVVAGLNNGQEGHRVAERYLTVLDEPFTVGDHSETLRVSVGVSATDDPDRVPDLVAEADMAMYHAKRHGGSQVSVFAPDMELEATATSRITRALRSADFDQEFSLVYQPIVSVDGQRIIGFESLLRWNSPQLGMVSPGEFIPVSERSGDICDIGSWVIEHVCRQVHEWEQAGLDPNLTVSMNVSPRQLANDAFVPRLLSTIGHWGLAAGRLVIEVTESTVLDSTGVAAQRLQELRGAGLKISIDDFGSGYSNLGQLLRVPFDIIKIDRSLLLTLSEMRELNGGDPADPCAIMGAIVSIAGVFSAPVVCEGVETDEQRQSLEASGITHVQGYLTGRPAPPEDTAALLAVSGLFRPMRSTSERPRPAALVDRA